MPEKLCKAKAKAALGAYENFAWILTVWLHPWMLPTDPDPDADAECAHLS